MSNKHKYVILFFVVCTFFINSTKAEPTQDFKKKYEDLFVIASSGEIKFKEMVQPAIDSIAAMDIQVVSLLIEELDTKSARERLTVINILKKIGSPAVPDLIRALGHSNKLIVQRVCWALGDIKDTTAVMPLIDISGHDRWQIRDQSVGSLGDLKDIRAEATIVRALSDSIGQVRKAAAVSAGKVGVNSSITILVGMLSDDFYGARMSALESLMKLDTLRVFEILKDSVFSESDFVSSLSCQALSRIGSDSSLAVLIDVFQKSELSLKAHAAEALIIADPYDNTGFQAGILAESYDLLNPILQLRISSALDAAKNEQEESEE